MFEAHEEEEEEVFNRQKLCPEQEIGDVSK